MTSLCNGGWVRLIRKQMGSATLLGAFSLTSCSDLASCFRLPVCTNRSDFNLKLGPLFTRAGPDLTGAPNHCLVYLRCDQAQIRWNFQEIEHGWLFFFFYMVFTIHLVNRIIFSHSISTTHLHTLLKCEVPKLFGRPFWHFSSSYSTRQVCRQLFIFYIKAVITNPMQHRHLQVVNSHYSGFQATCQ